MHTPKNTTRPSSSLTAWKPASVLEVIAHPEGTEIDTPHDQALLSQQSLVPPPITD